MKTRATFKIPLKLYAYHRCDKKYKNCCEKLMMEDIDLSKVSYLQPLGGEYNWFHDEDEYYGKGTPQAEKGWLYRKKSDGFTAKEIVMDVNFKEGYYIIDILSEIDLDSQTSWNKGYVNPEYGTVLEAVIAFFEGCISDGIGENPIGVIDYDNEKWDVWMCDLELINYE